MMEISNTILGIVVPCYNEEEVVGETANQLTLILESLISEKLISIDSFVLFANDGSKDQTWSILKELNRKNNYISAIKLARNVGHQNALVAGLEVALESADVVVTIDADLQDDVNAIKQMVKDYHEGNEIVYGVRTTRQNDSIFKKYSALLFYKLMNLLGTQTIYNHADFRLMSKRAVECFLKFPEKNLFIRGIVPLIGFTTSNVYYKRSERFAGETKYPFAKMLNFAVDGITSFSVKPLRIIFSIGFVFLFLTIAASAYIIIQYLNGNVVSGWSSLILSLWFIGSIIIISLGVIGEYIGKIYTEVKNRPRYIIESKLTRSGCNEI